MRLAHVVGAIMLAVGLLAPPSFGQTELIGGTVANPADWPASPWVGNCSSTLVGDRVLLTAAHCVSNGGTKSFTVGTTRYSGKCTHHGDYRRNSTADWALCLLTAAVPDVAYETVAAADEVECEAGATFLWTGYGCQRWGGGIDGKFRTGSVKATRCPRGTNYDTVTKGSVALCSGDSGGGGYVVKDGRRKLVGVNSRSNTTDTSYVSSTYTDTFRNWAMAWATERNVAICGVTKPGALRCNGEGPIVTPLPADCKTAVEKVTACLFGVPTRDALTDADACQAAVGRVEECEALAEVP